MCCNVLQRVAACCNVLQRVATCCYVLQRVATCCSVLQSVATAIQCSGNCVRECFQFWSTQGHTLWNKLEVLLSCVCVCVCTCTYVHVYIRTHVCVDVCRHWSLRHNVSRCSWCTTQLLSIILLKISWASNSCVSILSGLELLRGLWHTAQCVEACCSLLQSVAVRCTIVSVLQCVAVCCSVTLQCLSVACDVRLYGVAATSMLFGLQGLIGTKSVVYWPTGLIAHMQSYHTYWSTKLYQEWTHRDTLQHTATHWTGSTKMVRLINYNLYQRVGSWEKTERQTEESLESNYSWDTRSSWTNYRSLQHTATHCNT